MEIKSSESCQHDPIITDPSHDLTTVVVGNPVVMGKNLEASIDTLSANGGTSGNDDAVNGESLTGCHGVMDHLERDADRIAFCGGGGGGGISIGDAEGMRIQSVVQPLDLEAQQQPRMENQSFFVDDKAGDVGRLSSAPCDSCAPQEDNQETIEIDDSLGLAVFTQCIDARPSILKDDFNERDTMATADDADPLEDDEENEAELLVIDGEREVDDLMMAACFATYETEALNRQSNTFKGITKKLLSAKSSASLLASEYCENKESLNQYLAPRQGVEDDISDSSDDENLDEGFRVWDPHSKGKEPEMMHADGGKTAVPQKDTEAAVHREDGEAFKGDEEDEEDDEDGHDDKHANQGTKGNEGRMFCFDSITIEGLPDVVPSPIQLIPVGTVMTVVDGTVLVQASVESHPLDLGSVLCTADRHVIGPVSDTFGPVSRPYYVICVPANKELSATVKLEAQVFADATNSTFLMDNKNIVPEYLKSAFAGVITDTGSDPEDEEMTGLDVPTTTQPQHQPSSRHRDVEEAVGGQPPSSRTPAHHLNVDASESQGAGKRATQSSRNTQQPRRQRQQRRQSNCLSVHQHPETLRQQQLPRFPRPFSREGQPSPSFLLPSTCLASQQRIGSPTPCPTPCPSITPVVNQFQEVEQRHFPVMPRQSPLASDFLPDPPMMFPPRCLPHQQHPQQQRDPHSYTGPPQPTGAQSCTPMDHPHHYATGRSTPRYSGESLHRQHQFVPDPSSHCGMAQSMPETRLTGHSQTSVPSQFVHNRPSSSSEHQSAAGVLSHPYPTQLADGYGGGVFNGHPPCSSPQQHQHHQIYNRSFQPFELPSTRGRQPLESSSSTSQPSYFSQCVLDNNQSPHYNGQQRPDNSSTSQPSYSSQCVLDSNQTPHYNGQQRPDNSTTSQLSYSSQYPPPHPYQTFSSQPSRQWGGSH